MTTGAGPRAGAALVAGAALAAAAAYFLSAAGLGLTRIEFGDETEKFVAALMQRGGARLYRDVWTQHGPLSYVAPHALVAVLGPEVGLRATRVAVVLATLAAAAAIAWSPALRRWPSRAIAGATFLAALAPIWLLQALNLGIYHNLAGALAAVVLAQLTLPAILGVPVSPGAAFASGVAAGLVPFAAYSHGPAAVLFALAALLGMRAGRVEGAPRRAAAFAAGALTAAALVFGWLARYGDVRRFFVYHFAFNERIYSRFIEFDWTLPLASFAPRLAPELLVRAVAVFAAALGLAAIGLAATGPARASRLLRAAALAFAAAGLVMLNPRGAFGFAANALVLAGLATAALGAGLLVEVGVARSRATALAGFAMAFAIAGGAELASRFALSSPNWQTRSQVARHLAIFGEASGPREELVRAMADPGERVLALVYRPHFYLETGRLPASAQYYYLPWQAAYEREPVAGYETDLCRELRDRPPPVIFFDDWLVWFRYRFADYAPCIARLVEEEYLPAALDPEVRIRRDRFAERAPGLGVLPASRSAAR